MLKTARQQRVPVIPALERGRQEDSWGLLASRASQMDELQIQ